MANRPRPPVLAPQRAAAVAGRLWRARPLVQTLALIPRGGDGSWPVSADAVVQLPGPAFSPGQLHCARVDAVRFVLHDRLTPDIALHVGPMALHPFAVSNRANTYVYQEKSGAVFYLRLFYASKAGVRSRTAAPTTMLMDPDLRQLVHAIVLVLGRFKLWHVGQLEALQSAGGSAKIYMEEAKGASMDSLRAVAGMMADTSF